MECRSVAAARCAAVHTHPVRSTEGAFGWSQKVRSERNRGKEGTVPCLCSGNVPEDVGLVFCDPNV